MLGKVHLPLQPLASSYFHSSEEQENKIAFKAKVQNWREEKRNTPEYDARIQAEKLIETCIESRSQELSLDHLQLTSLPPIDFLHSLLSLNLNNNQLTCLPASLCNLKHLKNLNLSHNQLHSLPDEIGKLQSLEELNLENNQLTSLPESIYELEYLLGLNLNQNQFDFLSDKISRFQNLEELNLKNNQLTCLPASLYDLKNLRVLHLSENQIQFLTEGIRNLIHLEEVTLDNNPLDPFPTELVMMPKNCLISIKGCEVPLPVSTLLSQRNLIVIYS